jgi:exodeoxyribonuclease-3
MKIISWNVNGLRAVGKKGFWEWLEKSGADVVCLQETKIGENQLSFDLLYLKNYFAYFNCAKRLGYSGTAVFSKKKPLRIETKIGLERFDNEGRSLRLDFAEFSLLNLYLPHGGRQKENLGYKFEVYEYLIGYLKDFLKQQKKLILAGDFNIAHKEIDLARPKENQNNIMFTPEERNQVDRLLALGFIDTFRQFHKEGGHYSWWPYSFEARKRNLGWRIDYVFVSQFLTSKLKNAFILSGVTGSDHCPVGVEIAP